MKLSLPYVACVLFLSLAWGNIPLAAPSQNGIHLAEEPIQPVQLPKGLDERRVKLGAKLFRDPHLSGNNQLACSSCHILNKGGALNRKDALPGVSGKSVPINVPTVLGSGHNFAQFWDGRAVTLEDQISGPALNPDEMGSTWPQIIEKLKKDPAYEAAFKEIYMGPPTGRTSKMRLPALNARSSPRMPPSTGIF